MTRIITAVLIIVTSSSTIFSMIHLSEANKKKIHYVPVKPKKALIISTDNVAEKFCTCLKDFMTFNVVYLKQQSEPLMALFKLTNTLMKNQTTIFSDKHIESLSSHWMQCTQNTKKITTNERIKIKQQFINSIQTFQDCLKLLGIVSCCNEVINTTYLYDYIINYYKDILNSST